MKIPSKQQRNIQTEKRARDINSQNTKEYIQMANKFTKHVFQIVSNLRNAN